VTVDEKLRLAVTIAAYFTAHDMRVHLEKLRGYYARVRDGRSRHRDDWDDAMVQSWAEMLRMPPFDSALKVRRMCSNCTCGDTRHDSTRPICFPSGWRVTCLACGAQWLELREPL
jgi:hypothetical protein